MPPPDFVLGCERSGSTWLANALDAHAESEVFLEPFADYAALFPGVPGRFAAGADPDDAACAAVREVFARLPRHKHPGCYRPGRAEAWRRVDALWQGLAAGAARAFGAPTPRLVQRARLLDLHAAHTPPSLRTRKARLPRASIVKELRLNLRVGLLRRAFPSARCLVVIRDPGAQVASVQRLFAAGRLGELRRDLASLGPALASAERLRAYRPLAARVGGDPTSSEALLSWWLVSYDVLLGDCRRLGIQHRVVYHEAIAREPLAESAAALDFLGLPASDDVVRYVRASTSRDVARDAPLSTFRETASHSERTRAAVPETVRQRTRELIETYAASEALRRYAATGA